VRPPFVVVMAPVRRSPYGVEQIPDAAHPQILSAQLPMKVATHTFYVGFAPIEYVIVRSSARSTRPESNGRSVPRRRRIELMLVLRAHDNLVQHASYPTAGKAGIYSKARRSRLYAPPSAPGSREPRKFIVHEIQSTAIICDSVYFLFDMIGPFFMRFHIWLFADRLEQVKVRTALSRALQLVLELKTS